MDEAAKRHKQSAASSTEQPADLAEWLPWHKAREHGPDSWTAGRELDAARRAGKIRTLVRYSAPDGTVEWRKPPADLTLVNTLVGGLNTLPGGDLFQSDEWNEERRKRGGRHMIYVHRAGVGQLWPSGEQPAVPAVGSNPRGAGRKPKYDREFLINQAWAYVFERGLPEPVNLETLVGKLRDIHGAEVPEISYAKEILGPTWRLILDQHGRR